MINVLQSNTCVYIPTQKGPVIADLTIKKKGGITIEIANIGTITFGKKGTSFYIHYLENNKRSLKGIGTFLLEQALYYRMQNKELAHLPVQLDTSQDSHFFYWKLGFCPSGKSKEMTKKMAYLFELHADKNVLKKEAEKLGTITMTLDHKVLEKWEKEIAFKQMLLKLPTHVYDLILTYSS